MKTFKELTAVETKAMSLALKACADFKAEAISEKQFMQRVKAYTFSLGENLVDNAKEAIVLHFDSLENERAARVIMPSKKQNKITSNSVDMVYRGLNGCIKKYAQTLNGVNGQVLCDTLIKSINDSNLKPDQAAIKIAYLKDAKNTFIELKPFWLSFPSLVLVDSKKLENDGLRPYVYTCKGYDYNHANNSNYFLDIVDAFLFSTLDAHKEAKFKEVDTAWTAAKFRYNCLVASKSDAKLQAFKDENTIGLHEAKILGIMKDIETILDSVKDKDLMDVIKSAKMKAAKLRAEYSLLDA